MRSPASSWTQRPRWTQSLRRSPACCGKRWSDKPSTHLASVIAATLLLQLQSLSLSSQSRYAPSPPRSGLQENIDPDQLDADISSMICDCDICTIFHGCGLSPGCRISTAAPPRGACLCDENALRTACSGSVVSCTDPAAALCLAPDLSEAACRLAAGGECNGY